MALIISSSCEQSCLRMVDHFLCQDYSINKSYIKRKWFVGKKEYYVELNRPNRNYQLEIQRAVQEERYEDASRLQQEYENIQASQLTGQYLFKK